LETASRQDIRGSVTNVVDSDGALGKSYIYSAYGSTQAGGTFSGSFAYTGALLDEETGLTYMNARYYDSESGRFISEDMYRGDGEKFWHLYAYCEGDPVNYTDKSGHNYSVLRKNVESEAKRAGYKRGSNKYKKYIRQYF
jgi:RHS repeat-associated protein